MPMAEVRKLRIGFVGCGFMGQKAHLRNYVTLTDECEVVAVAEPREKQRHLVATRYGIKEEYKDHLDLLKNAKVDAVVAAQPYSHHAAIIPDILNAKVPVFTEKPVAFSIEAGQMLADTADSNGTLYMVGYHKRSDPAIEYAKAKIDAWKASGEMGRMRLVRISMPPGDWVFNGGNGALGVAGEQYPPIKNEEWPDYFGNMDKMKEY
ncbi:MAG: Gfo/Idh/MocA family oxidoreductase, partial [Oscillospiraceae bacterium]|nr:Gfo/Idh/MocA family oxidoreductase [Oscillospiraceae bacterium]